MPFRLPSARRLLALVCLFAAVVGAVVTAPEPNSGGPVTPAEAASPSAPEPCPTDAEWRLRDLVNAFRASHGKPALTLSAELMRKAQAWSDHLAAVQGLSHSTLSDGLSPGWTFAGENVALASSGIEAAETGLEHSPTHYRNLVGDFTEMGLGVTTDAHGVTWVAQVFVRRPTPTRSYGGPGDASAFTPIPSTPVFRPSTTVPDRVVSSVKVAGVGRVPAGATAVATVLEVWNARTGGWFQVLGPGDVVGATSSLTLDQGRGSVLSITKVASDGTIRVTGSTAANVRLSVVGYFSRTTSQVRAGRFVSIDNARLLDTRSTSRVAWTGGRPTAGTVVTVPVLGRGGVPRTAVRAVVVNVVAVDPDSPGSVQVGVPGMVAGAWNSMLVPRAGRSRAGLVIAPLDSMGRLSIRSTFGSHFVVDVRGWFTGGSDALSTRGLFVPVSSARVLDTRSSGGPTSGLRTVPLATRAGMPSCPSAVFGNVTLIPTTTAYAQLGPSGEFRFGAWSTMSATIPGLPVKNTAIVRTGQGYAVGIYHRDPAQVVLDLSGWFV